MEGKGRCAFVADVNPYGLEVLDKSINFHVYDWFNLGYCRIVKGSVSFVITA